MSSSKSKTTSNQTSNQTAKTTPDVPSWIQQPSQNYYAQVNALADSGQPFVSGPSALQQQSFQGASNLGAPRIGGNNVFDLAGMLGMNAGTAGANTTSGTALSRFSGYRPVAEAQTQGYTGQGYTAGGPATVDGYTASGAFTPQGYDPSVATSQGYQAQGYNPTLGSASGYQAQGYQAGMIDPRAFQVGQTQVGPMAQASARNFTDANFSAYENPYTGAVTDTTIADIDANDARIRAQQAAMQAANGGLRNSNNAVLSSLTEGELSRARAASLANIRSQGFNTAAGLISGDNDRQANVSQFNAGQTNQGVLAQASADSSRNSLMAQLQSAGLLSNQSAFNQAAQFGAGAANDAGQFNAGSQNQFGLANMGAANEAGQFNSGQTNQANQFNSGLNAQTSQFNAGQANDASSLLSQQLQQAGLDFAGRSDQAGQFGADARNRSALDAAGRNDAAGQFGANARNQANQFGADAFNRSSLDFAGRADQAGQFGADAFNRNSQYNAAALNQNNQFNAGQQDSALMRQLQAAGLLGNLGTTMGADQRANIGLQADLGGEQRNIQNAQGQSEYARLAMLQGLLGVNPNNFIGQSQVSSGTQTGTTTQSQNPGLMGILGGLGTLGMGLGQMGWSPFGASK